MVPNSQSNVISSPKSSPLCSAYQVLVIDDDRPSRKLVAKVLQSDDLVCATVSSAAEALHRIEESAPDLILCDIDMPVMDGIEFCAHLRRLPIHSETPVIFFTGLSDSDTITRAFESGANDYIVKPIRSAEVVSRTRLHLQEHQRSKQAKAQIDQLDQQNKSKSRFLGVASHDLRNPLVSIRGISQYLVSERFGPLNEEQKELVDTVVQASESMLTLVEELLDVSLIESNKDRTHLAEEDLAAIARAGAKLHSANADRKNIAICQKISESPILLDLDRKLISRLLDNLISNAVKFSPPKTQVTVTVDQRSDRVHLLIDDQGPGIPKDEFSRLFKEFSRTSNQPTAGESSSGIGLYVCKQIADTHQATIEAINLPEGGARFAVVFPNKTSRNE